MLCKNSKDISNGLNKVLWCNISNYSCGFYRWCQSDNCIKMIDGYDCKLNDDKSDNDGN